MTGSDAGNEAIVPCEDQVPRRVRSRAACMASMQRGFGAFFDTLERPSPTVRALSVNAARLRQGSAAE